MTWVSSNRKARLPRNWSSIRLWILERDDWMCRIQTRGICVTAATEVDHIRAGDDHSEANLQAACEPCHHRKSSHEGGSAKAAKRRRPAESHPGLK